jgi:hypothetical protein
LLKKRLHLTPSEGGLGLFNIKDFLHAQRCTWIKRSIDLTEPWKALLYISNYGRIFNCKSKNINKLEYPVCHNISESFEQFSNAFTVTNENFLNSYIFESSKITLDVETRETLSNLFANNYFACNAFRIYRLRYCGFYDDNGFPISSERILENTGVELTQLQIFRFRNACMVAKMRYKKKMKNSNKWLGSRLSLTDIKREVVTYGS